MIFHCALQMFSYLLKATLLTFKNLRPVRVRERVSMGKVIWDFKEYNNRYVL
jgi:hypothetical protein